MTTAADIRKSALNRYRDFLKSASSSFLLSIPGNFFPWVYRGNKGKKGDSYSDSLSLYRELLSSSKETTGYGYSISTEAVNTRTYGEQTVIREISIADEMDYLAFTGKEKEYRAFLDALSSLKSSFQKKGLSLSSLDSWVKGNLDFLQEEKEDGYYDSLFLALSWLMDNPGSGLYIREIPLSLHTKFIEENERVILSLYSSLTGKEIDSSFEETFGLRRKEMLVRYRMENTREETGLRMNDFVSLPSREDLSGVKRIFVVENEIVYLTFPIDRETMCIFGGGFAAASLRNASWLKSRELYYFGDEDEHGYEILALFRSSFPSVRSFLMDWKTYLDHEEYAVKGKKGTALYDSYLTEEEMKVLCRLRSNPSGSRLEQERISLRYIKETLEKL